MNNEELAKMQAKYDFLVERMSDVEDKLFDIYDEIFDAYCDERITLSNIHYEASRNAKSFLEAGFDANQIIGLLSCQGVWENYDELKAHGAKSHVLKKKVLDYLEYLYNYNETSEIVENFATFYKRGVGFTTILRYTGIGYFDWSMPQRNGDRELPYNTDWRPSKYSTRYKPGYDARYELGKKMTYETLLKEGMDEETIKELLKKYQKFKEKEDMFS